MLELNRDTSFLQYKQGLVQSHFVGLSTEDKPTEGADGETLTAGCVFDELDTGDRYWFDGLNWRRPLASKAEDFLESIDAKLEAQNDLLSQMLIVLAEGLSVNA